MTKSSVPSKPAKSTSIPTTTTSRELFGVAEKVQWEFETDKSNLNHNFGVFTTCGIHRRKLAFAPTDALEEVRYFHEHFLIGRDQSYRKELYVAKAAGAMVAVVPREHTRGLRPVECIPYPLYTVHCHFNPDDYDLAEFGPDHPNTRAARARRRYTVEVKDYVYADGRKHFNPDDYDLAEFGADHPNTRAARAHRHYTVEVKDYVYVAGEKKVR